MIESKIRSRSVVGPRNHNKPIYGVTTLCSIGRAMKMQYARVYNSEISRSLRSSYYYISLLILYLSSSLLSSLDFYFPIFTPSFITNVFIISRCLYLRLQFKEARPRNLEEYRQTTPSLPAVRPSKLLQGWDVPSAGS